MHTAPPLGKIKDTLYGTDEVDGLLNSYLSSGGTYGAVKGKENSEKSYDAYLSKAKQDELIALIDKTFGDNAYFMGTSAHNDAKSSMFDSVHNLGSKNQSYNDYLKYDAEQKLNTPSNYNARGAVANIKDSIKLNRYNGGGGIFGNTGFSPASSSISAVYQGEKHKLGNFDYKVNNEINANYGKAINGDVIKHYKTAYVKYAGGWHPMYKL